MSNYAAMNHDNVQQFIGRMQRGAVIEIDHYEPLAQETPVGRKLTALIKALPLPSGVHFFSSENKIRNILEKSGFDQNNNKSQWLIYGGLLNDCIMRTVGEIMNSGKDEEFGHENRFIPDGSINSIVIPLFASNHTYNNLSEPVLRFEQKDRLPEELAEHSTPGHIHSGMQDTRLFGGEEYYFNIPYGPSSRVIIRKNGEILRTLEPGSKEFKTIILDFYTSFDDMQTYGFSPVDEAFPAINLGNAVQLSLPFDNETQRNNHAMLGGRITGLLSKLGFKSKANAELKSSAPIPVSQPQAETTSPLPAAANEIAPPATITKEEALAPAPVEEPIDELTKEAEKLYIEAMELFNQGHYNDAKIIFNELDTLKPDFKETRGYLQRYFEVRGREFVKGQKVWYQDPTREYEVIGPAQQKGGLGVVLYSERVPAVKVTVINSIDEIKFVAGIPDVVQKPVDTLPELDDLDEAQMAPDQAMSIELMQNVVNQYFNFHGRKKPVFGEGKPETEYLGKGTLTRVIGYGEAAYRVLNKRGKDEEAVTWGG